MISKRQFQIITLGCKVNQYESQFVRELLEHAGWTQTDSGQNDLCVVNTCTVTHEADAKGRQAIRRIHAENPKADLVVMGDRLDGLPQALEIARRTMAKVRQNLVWAFGYNLIVLPIAAGALLPGFGIRLSPPLAALLMALSSITVVVNALLLQDDSASRVERGG